VSDADAPNFIRIFSLKEKGEIEAIEAEHNEAPQLRKLQRALAEDITIRVHGQEQLVKAQATTDILFGASFEDFKKLTGPEIEDAFDESLTFRVSRELFEGDVDPVSLLGEKTTIYSSKGEARKAIQGNGVSINKEKIKLERKLIATDLLYDKYILAQKGRRDYFLIIAE